MCSEACDAVPPGEWFPVSQRNCLHHQGLNSPRIMVLTFSLDCLTMNMKALRSFRNIENWSSSDTASYSSSPAS